MSFPSKTTFTFDWTSVPDVLTPGVYTAAQLKDLFNERDQELLDFVNSLIATLASTTSLSSGAENIGSATISGAPGTTVYAQLVSLQAEINALVGGAIPPSSVTTAMLQTSSVTTIKIADNNVTYDKMDSDSQADLIGGEIYAYKNLGGF